MTSLVSLNGEILPPEKATVSVFDRGFLYGDSVYEVVRTYSGVPFELEAHLQRLRGSAERIGMQLPATLEAIGEETWRTHLATGNVESYLRIVVTRGSGEIGLDPALARSPLMVVIAKSLEPPAATAYEQGSTISLVSVRRNLKSAVDPAAKTGNYLNSVMALAEARARGGSEAVMLDHRDLITEGASSNVFMVLGGVVLTPPLDVGILKGVTREVIFEVAQRAGLRVLEAPITAEMLKSADEVFITSSIRELVPIVRADEVVIGTGAAGPIAKRLRAGFKEYVHEYTAKHRR